MYIFSYNIPSVTEQLKIMPMCLEVSYDCHGNHNFELDICHYKSQFCFCLSLYLDRKKNILEASLHIVMI